MKPAYMKTQKSNDSWWKADNVTTEKDIMEKIEINVIHSAWEHLKSWNNYPYMFIKCAFIFWSVKKNTFIF